MPSSHLGSISNPCPQAAIGRVQLRRLPDYIEARKKIWETLRIGLSSLEDVLEFALPTHATDWQSGGKFNWDQTGCRCECSWFGFKIAIKPEAPFSRTDLTKHLEANGIGNRMLFGGNLVRQPAFVQLQQDRPEAFRQIGDLSNSDMIMNNTLFLGTYPGLTKDMLDFEINVITKFVEAKTL